MKRKPTPEFVVPYLPFFTHEILVNDWPPGWLPAEDWGKNSVLHSELAVAARGKRMENGDTGSIPGLSIKADARLAQFKGPRR